MQLRALAGPLAGSVSEVGPTGAAVGRAPDDTIAIPDTQLSRHHARLDFSNGAFWLSDLGTTNGTHLNGARLTAPQEVHAGDRIAVGETVLTVTLQFR